MNRPSRMTTRRGSTQGWKVLRAKTQIKKQRKQRAQTADPAIAFGPSSSGRRVGKAMMIMVILHVLAVVGFVLHNRWFEEAAPVPLAQDKGMINSRFAQKNLGKGKIHPMRNGESFQSVATNYGVSLSELRQANPGKLGRAGDILTIPAAKITPTENLDDVVAQKLAPLLVKPTRAVEKPVAVPAAASQVHTVVSGDTLYGVSSRYGVSVAEIKELNDLQTDSIRVGQKLDIP